VDDPDSQAIYIVDSATGLFNDRFLHPLLADELTRLHLFGRTMGVLLVEARDDDGIIALSDSADDRKELLQLIASSVESVLEDNDTPGVLRRRPPAVLVLLPEADLNQLADGAQRVTYAVNEAVQLKGRRACLGLVAVFPGHKVTADAVIDAANRSLRTGRPELLGR
jgi:GGDEF domain-containing protein